MKWEVKDLKYGEIVYEESFWTGKRKIVLNGMEMTKEVGRTYTCPYGEEEIRAKVKGNFLIGVKMKIEDDTVVLVQRAKWYEILLSVLIPVIVFLSGNKIVPIFNGALVGGFTGAFAGAGMIACIFLIKKMNSHIALKFFVWFGILLAVFLLSYSFSAFVS